MPTFFYLDNVIRIARLYAVEDVRLELSDQNLALRQQDMFESLLHHLSPVSARRQKLTHPTTVHLHRQREDVILHLLGESSFLALIAVLKQLLDDVVAEYVGHELIGIRHDLIEDLLTLVGRASLDPVLDESRAMLIATKLDDIAVDIL